MRLRYGRYEYHAGTRRHETKTSRYLLVRVLVMVSVAAFEELLTAYFFMEINQVRDIERHRNFNLPEGTEGTRQQQLLTCHDIQNLEVVRRVASGKNKVAFEVKLPGSGDRRAIAKRCYSNKCLLRDIFKKETNLLNELQQQYGSGETLGYFGQCQASEDSVFKQMLEEGVPQDDVLRNFSVGFTSILEMGEPLQCKTDSGCSKCLTSHFTESDVTDLKQIANQYANFSKSPLVLRQPSRKNTDNKKAEQYVVTSTGIRHADLEMVYYCNECSFDRALEINCSVLRGLLDDPGLNCALTTTIDVEGAPLRDRRINVTDAVNNCSALIQKRM